MKPLFICAVFLASIFLLCTPQSAYSQYAYGLSDIAADSNARRVYGYSTTYLDYKAGYYYDPAVQGALFDQYDNEVPLDQGYAEGYADEIDAEVFTQTSVYRPRTRYDVYSNHFVRAYFYYSSCSGFSSGCYWDPFGFSSFTGNRNGGYPGGPFNSYYFVVSRLYYLGTTGKSLVTPSDQCLTGAAFDEGGTPCPSPTPTPTPTPTPQVTAFYITADDSTLYPDQTGGKNKTTVRVITDPPSPNIPFTLTLKPAPRDRYPDANDFGGHIESRHTGGSTARPKGRLSKTRGVTDASGRLNVTYYTSAFNSQVEVSAADGNDPNNVAGWTITAEVPGLQELGEGENYALIGFTNTPWHPQGTNHWGIPDANTGLSSIADDYKARFFPKFLNPTRQ